MNTGAFGENFPYTNFHDLNLDWVIKIIKELMSKYDELSEAVEQGKTDITTITEESIDTLESTASQVETDFDTHAEEKARQTIASIPSDYTTFFHDAMQYRGNMETLGYTAFSSCLSYGYFNFPTAYVSNITDRPTGLNRGGVVFYIAPFGGSSFIQIVMTETNTWLRLGTSSWIEIFGGEAFSYRGKMDTLEYTTFSQCNQNGYYNFGTSYISNISDKPDGLTAGGIVIYYSHFGGTSAIWHIITETKEWMRLGSSAWELIRDESSKIIYRGKMDNLGYTTFAQCNKDGYYNFGTAYINSITDKPDDLDAGGIIIEYLHFGGTGSLQRIVTEEKEWVRLGSADWIPTRVPAIDRTVWYAFGDSITRGLYPYEDTVRVTTKNYVYWVARINNWIATNYGESGSGYLKEGELNHNAKYFVDNTDFTNCNLVTFAWGVNDWHYNQQIGTVNDSTSLGTTMASNMKYCIEKVLTENPTCKLIVILPMNYARQGGDFSTDWGLGYQMSTSGTLQEVINVMKQICEYYDIQYIDQSSEGVVNRVNIMDCLPDGAHPSLDTYKQIGYNLAKQLKFS